MTSAIKRPLALIILDGWGFSLDPHGNAIAMANTPYYDDICARYPSTSILAAGTAVGLSEWAVGNAENGHVNIGAGRVVKTVAAQIADSILAGTFSENSVLTDAFQKAVEKGSAVHFIGLLSDGDVHSSSETLFSLLRMAKINGISDAFVHAILDGRDVPQRTADIYVEALEIKMADIGIGTIASLCGRYYGMDSNENWERTARAFTMLVHAEGERATDAVTAVRSSFLRGISDEFVAPIVIETSQNLPMTTVKNGDLVVFFNHRADTMKQLVRSLAVPELGEASLSVKPQIDVVCLTEYERSFGLNVAFPPASRTNNLADVLSQHGISNYRISELDRFAHITRFFNGGSETVPPNERHIQVPPTPRVTDRESEPEMRSFKIADTFIRSVVQDAESVFVINMPAPGLVAETGNFERTVEAVQYVDTCLSGIVDSIREANGVAVITSTHGNCEEMLFANGEPKRGATANAVPFHIVDDAEPNVRLRADGSLQDVAPTILGILGIEKPESMSGSDLRKV
jgi:2,3-bisphosphoglycerate-independent phosphoglycerate mutase